MKDKKTTFAPDGDLDALDLFDSFSETEQGEDLIDPIGLIDVAGEDTGDTESENDFLSQLESGFLSPPFKNTADRFTTESADRDDIVPAGRGDEKFSETDPEAIAAVSPDQLEAALERVIDRIFTERVEAILREVIEKAVSEEIGKLRGALLDNIAVDDDL